jgi:predicted transcriptional regulator
MSNIAERAAAALALMPEEMQEQAVAYLYEQAEKLRVLKAKVQEGLDDVAAGRVSPFDMDEIRALVLEIAKKEAASES